MAPRSPRSTPPLRALHVLPWLGSGGVEQRRLALARGLPAHGWSLHIVTTSARPLFRDALPRAGCGLTITDAPALSPATIAALVATIRRVRPHVLHGAVFEGNLLAALTGRLCRVPIVLLEETSDTTSRSLRAHRLFRTIAHAADGVAAISPAVGDKLVRTTGVPESKVRIVNNGVARPPNVAPAAVAELRPRTGARPDDRIVGAVSRLVPLKRIDDLIRATREPAWPQRTRLVIVGDGPERQRLESLASELDAPVFFAGYQEDVHPWLAMMDVFALVPTNEGFGLALAEAMMHGLPSVITDVGGLPHVLGDEGAGLRVPPCAPDRIATAVAAILSEPDAGRARGERARDRALSHFTSEAYVDRLAAWYDELTRARGLRGT